MTKLYHSPIEPLYLSTSYYNSGRLDSSSAEMSIAGLITPPSGESDWDRSVWEIDARYDFGKGKKPLDPPAYSDSKAIIRLSFGQFKDEANKTRSETSVLWKGPTAGPRSFIPPLDIAW